MKIREAIAYLNTMDKEMECTLGVLTADDIKDTALQMEIKLTDVQVELALHEIDMGVSTDYLEDIINCIVDSQIK